MGLSGQKALQGTWVRFTWDLGQTALPTVPPEGTTVVLAKPDEAARVLEIVTEAYASDRVWKTRLPAIRDRMRARIAETINEMSCEYLLLRRGNDFAAASGIAREHWTGQNLLTGICVRPLFQQQRLGTFLLGYSLFRLRLLGLSVATVYTEEGSLADRKIYPLFGGQRETNVVYPGAAARPDPPNCAP
jgi:GNAT superfamily N-acetyltransferase